MKDDIFELQRKLVSLDYVIARAKLFLMNNVEEVKNDSGGVIGYKLELNIPQTKYLMDILDAKD